MRIWKAVVAIGMGMLLGGTAQAGSFALPSGTLPLPLKKHVQRFVDSTPTQAYQCLCPYRTFRAHMRPMRYSAVDGRFYSIMGSSYYAYAPEQLFVGGLPLTGPVTRPDNDGEYYLPSAASFYAESPGSGWNTFTVDGQDRLLDFDIDDRGYHYLAYNVFGWGIVKDSGNKIDLVWHEGRGGQGSIACVNGLCQPGATRILALRSGSQYYALVGGSGVWGLWDTTSPTSPSLIRAWKANVESYNRTDSGALVAITDGKSSMKLATPAQLAAGSTGATVSLPGGKYSAAAADGETFWMLPKGAGSTFTVYAVTGGSAIPYQVTTSSPVDFYYAYAGAGFLVGVDFSKFSLRVFSLQGSVEEEPGITQFMSSYYATAPDAKQAGILPVEYNGKTYFIWAANTLGDVYEVQAGDSIIVDVDSNASRGTPNNNSPTKNAGPYYGDLVTFDVAFNGTNKPSLINWDFGNAESGSSNTASSAVPASTTHRYSGLVTSGAISATKIVTAVAANNTEITDSTAVTLLVPKARLLVPGSGQLVESSSQPLGKLAYGSTFFDASDGVVEGHDTGWTLDTASEVIQPPSTPFPVGGCGVHELVFKARYDSFPRILSNLSYSVQPFVAEAEVGGYTGTTVTFVNKTYFGAAAFFGGAQWTEKWELLDSTGAVIGSPQVTTSSVGSTTSFIVSKPVPAGSTVRLTMSVEASAISAATCTTMVSDAVVVPLEKPDPKISILNCPDPTTLAGSCTLEALSDSGRNTADWTYQWYLNGSPVALQTSSSYAPSFPTASRHTVSVSVSNAFGSESAAEVLDVTTPPCVGAPDKDHFSLTYAPKTGRTYTFSPRSFGYTFQACDTYSWNFGDGSIPVDGEIVEHTYAKDGSYTVTLTVKNVIGSASVSRPLNIGDVTPPPPPPPPPPPSGSCPDATGKVFVGYSGPTSGCKPGLGSDPCGVGESVRFNVDTYGITIQSCHSVSWQFGDGGTSTSKTPSHAYQSAGTYSVTLKVNNGSVTATHTGSLKTAAVTCGTEAPSGLTISHFGTTSGCKPGLPTPCKEGEKFIFSIQSTGDYTVAGCDTIAWNFGDGTTSTTLQPQHTFTGIGPFNVTLGVTNTQGTYNTSTTIRFFDPSVEKPTVSVTPASMKTKIGSTINFVGGFTSDPEHPNIAYDWRVIRMEGSTDTVVRTVHNEGAISHTFNTLGDYRVEFTATNAGGVSTPAVAYVTVVEIQEYSFLIPVVAHLEGNNGTQWRTDLQIFNTDPLKGPIEFEFEFKGGVAGISKTIVMTSSTQIYEDFLGELSKPFPALEDAGPVIVTARGDSPPQMWSRTYTVDATGNGTYGQLIPAVSLDSSLESSEQTVKYVLPGLEISDRFRTNVGIVNPSSKTVTVNVLARDDTTLGVPIGNFDIQVPPLALVQVGDLSNRIPGIDEHPFSLNIQPLGNTPVVVYGSMIDMNSNDPVYVTGIRDSDQEASDKRVQILPGAGHLEQSNGTWRSDVVVYNADLLPIKFDLIYYDGSGNKIAEAKDQVLGNGAFVKVEDVLAWPELDNSPGDSFGVIKIETNDSANSVGRYPIVFARTYKDRGELGSFGQGIPAISPNDANVKVDQPAFLAGIRSDCSYYTNLGLVSVGNSPSKVKVTLLDDVTGVAVGTWQYVVDGEVVGINPNSSLIVTNIIRAISAVQSRGTLRIEVEEGGDVWAYASVIAAADPTRGCSLPEHTFDPEYIPAVKMPMP